MPKLQVISSVRGGELRIGLSQTGIALLHRQGLIRRHSVVLGECRFVPDAASPADQLAAELDRLLTASSCQGLPTRLILADHWVRYWMVTPPKNAAHILDCQAAAEGRFQALFGESLAEWKMAADWQARAPFLCSALPKKLGSVLQAVSSKHRLLLMQIVPEFVACWNRWRSAIAADHWFGVVHDGLLTLAVLSERRLCDLRSLTLPVQATTELDWLRLSVQRESTRLMRPMPAGVQLCGEVPPAWLQPVSAAGRWTCSSLAEAKPPELAQSAGELAPMNLLRLAAAGLR